MLFSSNRDGKQNDIYRYDIATKTVTQLTHTPENEVLADDHAGRQDVQHGAR